MDNKGELTRKVTRCWNAMVATSFIKYKDKAMQERHTNNYRMLYNYYLLKIDSRNFKYTI